MSRIGRFGRRRWIAAGGAALIAVLVSAGITAFRPRPPASPVLEGNGRIEGTEIVVSSRIPGRLVWLQVQDGERVARGQVLARLSDEELRAQVRQADAQVLAAQAQVLQAEAGANAARQQVSQALTALELARVSAASGAAQATAGVDATRARVAQARSAEVAARAQVESAIRQAEAARDAALARVGEARAAVRAADQATHAAEAALASAQRDLERLTALAAAGAVPAAQVDMAQTAREAALARHHAAESQQEQARAAVRQADAAVRQADAAVAAARSGRELIRQRQQDVAAAAAGMRQADAASAEAAAGSLIVALREGDVAAARDQLTRARALRAAAEAQRLAAAAARDQVKALFKDTVLAAPISGTVLRRIANQGELVAAGMPVVILVDLQDLFLKVYVTGADLGRVRLGDRAAVFVDAFPGRAFEAVVTEIAQQAEFTPKTVHMQDERARLVYGVRLRLRNPDGYLKPGMPADARVRISVPSAAR